MNEGDRTRRNLVIAGRILFALALTVWILPDSLVPEYVPLRDWTSSGPSPNAAREKRKPAAKLSAEESARWKAHGMREKLALTWYRFGFTPEEVSISTLKCGIELMI